MNIIVYNNIKDSYIESFEDLTGRLNSFIQDDVTKHVNIVSFSHSITAIDMGRKNSYCGSLIIVTA